MLHSRFWTAQLEHAGGPAEREATHQRVQQRQNDCDDLPHALGLGHSGPSPWVPDRLGLLAKQREGNVLQQRRNALQRSASCTHQSADPLQGPG